MKWPPSDSDLRRLESLAKDTTASASQIATIMKLPVAKVAPLVNELRAHR